VTRADLVLPLRLVAEAEERLDRTVGAMTDAEAAEPSLLPGWDRAMVVTHLARNAEGNARMIAARLAGEERPQYPGGPPARAAAIEEGRGASAAALLDDLRAAVAELAAAFGAVGDDQWEQVVQAGVGPRPIRQRVGGRRVEVEVHHADLGLAYSWRDWPEDLVEDQLPRRLRNLGGRAPEDTATGRWAIATPGGSWTVTVGDGVQVTDGLTEPTGTVRGSAAAVYAWLIGRAGGAGSGLEVDGDDRVLAVPEWFPWS
jgi:maleylpyruvate isomerase